MKAVTVLQVLVLQTPSRTSKNSDHVHHLRRRLDLWEKGDIASLTQESLCIQKRLRKTSRETSNKDIARTFNKLMMEGKVQGALRFLS